MQRNRWAPVMCMVGHLQCYLMDRSVLVTQVLLHVKYLVMAALLLMVQNQDT
jgi:hypothetical protein